MVGERKRFTVEIFGESYTLVSDEGAEHIERARMYVDALMRDIASKVGSDNAKKVAVLAALQAASQSIRAEDQARDRQRKAQQVTERVDALLKTLPSMSDTNQQRP